MVHTEGQISLWGIDAIGATAAHRVSMGSEDIAVGVIDGGFDLTHSALRYSSNTDGRFTHFNAVVALSGLKPPYNAELSQFGHGTAVAGIATANGQVGNRSILGVAPLCSVVPISLGAPPTANRLAACLDWATSIGCRVVNMSITTPFTRDASRALDRAWRSGMVLCASAGNYQRGKKNSGIVFPASHPRVIAVGSTDCELFRKRPSRVKGDDWGSAFGLEIDVVAPGTCIWSTTEKGEPNAAIGDNDDHYSIFYGTSAAAPHVAGLAALLLSIEPQLSNEKIRETIEKTCLKIHSEMYNYQCYPGRPNGPWCPEVGYGCINAAAAVQRVLLGVENS